MKQVYLTFRPILAVLAFLVDVHLATKVATHFYGPDAGFITAVTLWLLPVVYFLTKKDKPWTP